MGRTHPDSPDGWRRFARPIAWWSAGVWLLGCAAALALMAVALPERPGDFCSPTGRHYEESLSGYSWVSTTSTLLIAGTHVVMVCGAVAWVLASRAQRRGAWIWLAAVVAVGSVVSGALGFVAMLRTAILAPSLC